MFYEDLSPYAYWDGGDVFTDLDDGMRCVTFRPAYERLNVGWLEAGRPWTSGRAPQPFIDAVVAFDPYGAWPARFPGVRFPWVPDDAVLRHVDDV